LLVRCNNVPLGKVIPAVVLELSCLTHIWPSFNGQAKAYHGSPLCKYTHWLWMCMFCEYNSAP
jgi:hypothetical protein